MSQYTWKNYIIAFCIGILPFVISSRLLFLNDPPVWPDEPIFASLAKTFADSGTVATTIYGPNYGISKAAFFHHPLYRVIVSLWGKVFGFDIVPIRLFSICVSFFVLLGISTIIIKLFRYPVFLTIGLFLITTDAWFSRATRIGRMEIVEILFFVWSFYLFLLLKEKKYKSNILILGICLLTTSAFLVHAIGISIALTFGALIMFSNITWKRKTLISSMVILCPIIAFMFWYYLHSDMRAYFIIQYMISLERKAAQLPSINRYIIAGDSWQYIFYVHIAITGIAIYQTVIKRTRRYLLFLIPAIIQYVCIYVGKEMWYLAYTQPWMTLLLLAICVSPKRRIAIPQSALLGIIVLLVANYKLFTAQANTYSISVPFFTNYVLFSKTVASALPKESNILVSAIPDPTFELWKRQGSTQIYQFHNFPMNDPVTYQSELDAIDYVVANMYTETVLPAYIQKNTSQSPQIISAGGYTATIYHLVPKNKRKHIQ